GEERVGVGGDGGGGLAEVLGHGFHRAGAVAGLRGRLAHARHLAGGLGGAPGGGLDAAGDLLGGGALLGDGGGDRARDVADVADGSLDRADRLDRAHGGLLHAGNLRTDVLGGLGGLAGGRLPPAGAHGKAAAGLAGARRFDGGVEREQVGLLGDVGDQPHHIADTGGRRVELAHRRVGALGVADRLGGDGVRLRHLPVDLRHRRGELVGGGGNIAHDLRGIAARSGGTFAAGRGV